MMLGPVLKGELDYYFRLISSSGDLLMHENEIDKA